MRRLALLGTLLSACGSGTPSPDMAVGSFGSSSCGSCVQNACGQAIQSCSADSGCATWFACVQACPTGANGDADSACETACAPPSSPAGASARSALQDCRLAGAGTQCPCGHVTPLDMTVLDPLLTQTCSASTATNQCFKCEDEKCCDSQARCYNDPACHGLITCLKACVSSPPDAGTDPCIWDCEMSAPRTALVEFQTFTACYSILCSPPCSISNCATCLASSCQAAYIACSEDADCTLLDECGAQCATGDKPCIDACGVKYPAGKAKSDALLNCGTTTCAGQCG